MTKNRGQKTEDRGQKIEFGMWNAECGVRKWALELKGNSTYFEFQII